METVQAGVPPYGVKETLVVNGKSILNDNIEANHDKVQTEPVHSSDLYLLSLRSHWPT